MSWRNPGRQHANWSLDTYAEGVITALDVVRQVSRQPKIDLIGLCAGGTTAAAAAGALNARGEGWINSLSLFVSILDNRLGDSDFTLFVTEQSVAAQKQAIRRQGMMRERDILEMFAMLRLDESIFSFVRSNYFRGEAPLAHPLLFWSMDYTRVPAEMQCDFLDLSLKNSLPKKELRVLGRRVDLSTTDYPIYIMAGATDHITPWRACYRSARLFGGEVTFVLTNQNHTQTISAPRRQPASALLDGGPTAGCGGGMDSLGRGDARQLAGPLDRLAAIPLRLEAGTAAVGRQGPCAPWSRRRGRYVAEKVAHRPAALLRLVRACRTALSRLVGKRKSRAAKTRLGCGTAL